MIHSIIFDWKRTLYDPDDCSLIAGTKAVLQLLRHYNIPIVLIGKGGDDMRVEVERLGVKAYFSKIIFCEGYKDINLFRSYISTTNPKTTFFIGDRVRSELEIGNTLHATTIWVRQGKFSNEEPESNIQKPTYTISSLGELKMFLKEKLA